MKRKIQSGHGFWIVSDYSYSKRRQVCHCSACGMANVRPIGKYCRWCGTCMDQDSLVLTSESLDDTDECKIRQSK